MYFVRNKHQGFTVVELVITIVVIAILASITVLSYRGTLQQSEEVAVQADLQSIATELDSERTFRNAFPSSLNEANVEMPDSTDLIYRATNTTFCLEGTSKRNAEIQFYVTENGTVEPGTCPSTAASCFTFSNGTITGYPFPGPNTPAECTRDVVIPSEIEGAAVTAIGNYAFYDNELTSAVIPDSVTSIGQFAFDGNRLKTVALSKSLTSIGADAFYGNQLTEIEIPDTLTVIRSSVFAGNQLTSVTIPDTVTTIEARAFAWNQLTSVTIPDSVTSIGSRAFYTNQLTSVTIPSAVSSIGSDAFSVNSSVNCRIPTGTSFSGTGCVTFSYY